MFLSVDVDVLDPAYAPGTGTPEPGGMTAVDLLWACREIAARTELVGMDVVEVAPRAIGSSDITALVADRIVREVLTGVALAQEPCMTAESALTLIALVSTVSVAAAQGNPPMEALIPADGAALPSTRPGSSCA